MQTFFSIALRSIPLVLFSMLVSVGFLAFSILPGVANWLAGSVCTSGETLSNIQTPYSLPGESGIAIDYYCEGPGGRRQIGIWDLIKAALAYYVGFFLIIVWPFITLLRFRSATRIERLERNGIPATVRILAIAPTTMEINDQPVIALTMEVTPQGGAPLVKKQRKAIPHILIPHIQPGREFPGLCDPRDPTKVLVKFDDVLQGQGAASDPTSALRTLKALHDEGLISSDEYDAKRAQIIERM